MSPALLRQASAALERGEWATAEALCQEALASTPEDAEALYLLGAARSRSGDLDGAITAFEQARSAAPADPVVLGALGGVYAAQGRLSEARSALEAAVAIAPRTAWVLENLGAVRRAEGDFSGAQAAFLAAAAVQPNSATAHAGLCGLAEHAGRWSELEDAAQRWIACAPNEHAAWRALAKAQGERGFLQNAVESYRKAIALGANDAINLATFARLCMSISDYEAAEVAIEHARRLDEENAFVGGTYSLLKLFRGELDEAERACRQVLAGHPNDATSFSVLSEIKRGRLPGEDVAHLRRLSEDDSLPEDERIIVRFTLADCLDASGDIEAAFDCYTRANAASAARSAREGYTYDRAAHLTQIDAIASRFGALKPRKQINGASKPIFIVGMPRSGTTLIESVLGAHSRVIALGERAPMRWIMQAAMQRDDSANPSLLEEWRRLYWQGAPVEDAKTCTDKNPWNFDAVALIAQLFPHSAIVHVRRNPVETGLSIFRNQFSKFMPFATDLTHIGEYYGVYARLMEHWEKIAPGRLITIQYEDFVSDFDASARALVAGCGLGWEDGCLNFWSNSRIVATMSTVQARRPPVARSRAIIYEKHLGPLVSALEVSGVDLRTGEFKGETP